MQKYEQIATIGKGSFGVVKKVKRIIDGRQLVWKQMKYGSMSSRQKQQLVTQVNLLKSMNHPNIVKYYDRIVDKRQATVYIIMEYCREGDVGQMLKQAKKKGNYLPEEAIWKIFYQLMLALDYCHSRTQTEKKIIHRDIKPANIFVDQGNVIKLGDFGLSREMGEYSQFAQTHVGTPYYMSPQQVKEAKYNEKSDIWSAGCLLYELAALRRPFQASNQLALAKKIEQGRFQRIPLRYSQNLFDLIKSMLVIDPEKRASAKQILKIPLFSIRTQENLLRQKNQQLKRKQEKLKLRQIQLMRQYQILSPTLLKRKSSTTQRQRQRQRYQQKYSTLADKQNMKNIAN